MKFLGLFILAITSASIESGKPKYRNPSLSGYRPDSSSCDRFHTTIARGKYECVKNHVLYTKMHCHFHCEGEKKRLTYCHKHQVRSRNSLKYPNCDDIFCRPQSDYVTCNELYVYNHNGESPNVATTTHGIYPGEPDNATVIPN